MIGIPVAILTVLTLLAMTALCRWAWRVHDRRET